MTILKNIGQTLVRIGKEIVPLANGKETKEDIRALIAHPTKKSITKFFGSLGAVLKEIISGLDIVATIKKIVLIGKRK